MIEPSWDGTRVFVAGLIATCVFLVFNVGQNVFAHGGGLNAQGCHVERAKEECHCHRNKDGKKLSPPVASEKKCEEDDSPSEMDFVAKFCHAREGQIEKSLPHRRRADCVTESHAIEGDFAHKWEEAYSQSQQYARGADKKAGILLILENEKDEVYIKELCARIADQQDPIDVFAIGHGFAEKGESVFCPDEI